MNQNHAAQEFDPRESPLDAAVAAVLAERIPDAAIRRVEERALMLDGAEPASVQQAPVPGNARALPRGIAGGLIAAAAVAAMAIGISLFVDRDAGSAFAQVVDNVKAADSVRFTMTWRLGRDVEQTTQMFLQGDLVRSEIGGGLVQIADLASQRVLYLDTQRKLAQSTVMDEKLGERLANPVAQVRGAKSDDAEPVGEEELGGKRCTVFRMRDVRLLGVAGDMLLWVDPDSGLPVRFVVHNDQLKRDFEVRIDDLVWNEPIDQSLFALNMPEDYQTGEIVPQVVRMKPADTDKAALDSPNVGSDGLLSRDRVPARIVWNPAGTVLTALMRDPEATGAAQHRLNELRQWDIATGKLRWSVDVAGAGTFAASGDGRLLALATGEDVQIRNARTGEIEHRWENDLFSPDLAFAPGGKSLALAVARWKSGAKGSGGVQIWDSVHGTLERTIEDDGPTTFIAYSPDGAYLATASNSGPVRLWATATGELARVFPGTKCAFAPDGRIIACTSMENAGDDQRLATVNLYDLETAMLVSTLSSERATATSWLLRLAFSPNGELLAAANWDGTVTLWDVASGERTRTLSHHAGGVHQAVFSPDGSTLATGSEDKTLRLLKLSQD